MAVNPINVLTTLRAVQYDGTNSAEIIALDPGFDFNNDSEIGGVWSFQSPPDSTSFVVQTNDYILYAQNQVFYRKPPNEFNVEYSCNITCEDMTAALDEAIEGVTDSFGEQIRALGVAAVPTLLLSSSANVDVTLQPAMPDTSFTAHASKFASVSLTDLVINSVTIIDEDTVRVNVSNVGLLTLSGASVMVHAVA